MFVQRCEDQERTPRHIEQVQSCEAALAILRVNLSDASLPWESCVTRRTTRTKPRSQITANGLYHLVGLITVLGFANVLQCYNLLYFLMFISDLLTTVVQAGISGENQHDGCTEIWSEISSIRCYSVVSTYQSKCPVSSLHQPNIALFGHLQSHPIQRQKSATHRLPPHDER
jgi:hypothetical protein